MSNLKIGDKVQIMINPFKGEFGRIIDIDDEYEDAYIVNINLGEGKNCVNNYTEDDLILIDDGGLGEGKELSFANNINEAKGETNEIDYYQDFLKDACYYINTEGYFDLYGDGLNKKANDIISIFDSEIKNKKYGKAAKSHKTSADLEVIDLEDGGKRIQIKGLDLNEGLEIDEDTLKLWLSDNDANYWSQEINESNEVPLRGQHNNIIGTYNFTTNKLKLNEASKSSRKLNEELYETAFPSIKGEHCEEVIPSCEVKDSDFLEDYLYKYDMNENDLKYPSWEFIGKIAAAENVTEKSVLDFAIENKYNVFCINAYNYEKLVVAANGITKEDIYNDYANFLEGNVTVKQVK